MKREDVTREKIVDIGLNIKSLNPEIIENLLYEIEKYIRKYLARKVGPEYLTDTSIILRAETLEDKVSFIIEVSFSAPRVLNIDYERIVDEAIDGAFEIIERRLKALGKDYRE